MDPKRTGVASAPHPSFDPLEALNDQLCPWLMHRNACRVLIDVEEFNIEVLLSANCLLLGNLRFDFFLELGHEFVVEGHALLMTILLLLLLADVLLHGILEIIVEVQSLFIIGEVMAFGALFSGLSSRVLLHEPARFLTKVVDREICGFLDEGHLASFKIELSLHLAFVESFFLHDHAIHSFEAGFLVFPNVLSHVVVVDLVVDDVGLMDVSLMEIEEFVLVLDGLIIGDAGLDVGKLLVVEGEETLFVDVVAAEETRAFLLGYANNLAAANAVIEEGMDLSLAVAEHSGHS